MSECPYCFSQSYEPHHPRCPLSGHASEPPISGLVNGSTLDKGHYRVGTALGQGGFGITYLCKDQRNDSKVVVKEFFPNKFSNRKAPGKNEVVFGGINELSMQRLWKQFRMEYELTAKAAQPGVPKVYGFFSENNTAYIAMEFVAGMTFEKYLRKKNRLLPWWELRNKFYVPLLKIVGGLHRKKILHRDISMVNVMITPDERVFLLDFGAGRDFSKPDVIEKMYFANKKYAPIEQTKPQKGLPQGPWTDIYALGTVFYVAVTGHYPPMALERPRLAVESALTYVPSLPEPFDNALMKSLYYYPQHRFQNVGDFWAALDEAPDPPIPTAGMNNWKKIIKRTSR